MIQLNVEPTARRVRPRVDAVRLGAYVFRQLAPGDCDDALFRLNHAAFVDELGQHAAVDDGRLVDRFHERNTYFTASRDGRLIGMVAVNDSPPFSVADKLPDPSVLRILTPRPLEVRLLTVTPTERATQACAGLLWMTYRFARAGDYSHLLISGVETRRAMYEHLGFEAIGPVVSSGAARFAPMLLDMAKTPSVVERTARRLAQRARSTAPRVSLAPGPVELCPRVRRALRRAPLSHRSPSFVRVFEHVRSQLCALTNSADVALLAGSGTLVNDVVATTLALDRTIGEGVVLVNGEFGRRLTEQARRAGLTFSTIETPWGAPWDLRRLALALDSRRDVNWVWGVHLETSTGMLNDVQGLRQLAASRDVRVCLDCVSSIGAVPLNLSGVHLATGVSGKSLGGAAGVAFVFGARSTLTAVDSKRAPDYLDLRAALRAVGPRFTFPSAPLLALHAALQDYATPERRAARFAHYAQLGASLRRRLREFGLTPMVSEQDAAPVIATFAPPAGASSVMFAKTCEEAGFEISTRSAYLRQRGLCQIAVMGDVAEAALESLFERLQPMLRS